MYIGRYSSFAALESRFTPEMRKKVGAASGGTPNDYSKLAAISGQPVAVAKQQDGKTVITNRGTPSKPPAPDNGGCKKKACPPPPNKQDIIGWWNQKSCEFENFTCGALPDYGLSVIVGLGGVLLFALLVKRR